MLTLGNLRACCLLGCGSHSQATSPQSNPNSPSRGNDFQHLMLRFFIVYGTNQCPPPSHPPTLLRRALCQPWCLQTVSCTFNSFNLLFGSSCLQIERCFTHCSTKADPAVLSEYIVSLVTSNIELDIGELERSCANELDAFLTSNGACARSHSQSSVIAFKFLILYKTIFLD